MKVNMLLYNYVLDYLEASDTMLMGIMMRFRTLSATNQTLVQMLVDRADQVLDMHVNRNLGPVTKLPNSP